MRIADKIRGLNTLQKLSVPLMVVFFVCMNMGFVKYNDAITIVSIIMAQLQKSVDDLTHHPTQTTPSNDTYLR